MRVEQKSERTFVVHMDDRDEKRYTLHYFDTGIVCYVSTNQMIRGRRMRLHSVPDKVQKAIDAIRTSTQPAVH
ncbi:hypothetical protein AWV80_38780 [Cupriavidus sp. UYMU48A]|nr:hypothetical protein AWV80_38780 [Cupriavidus sp. UYMU48A]